MGDPVVHFEISAADPAQSGKFYSDLFGWKTQEVPEYLIVDTFAGGGINGGIGKSEEGSTSRFYVAVADPQEALDRAVRLGAQVLMGVTDVLGAATIAILSDVAGNQFGLVKEADGPGVSVGGNPPLAWFEVLGPDADALNNFYSELFGWELKVSDIPGGGKYAEVETGIGRGIPGGLGSSQDGAPAVRLYAQVDDLAKTLEQAERLGAKTSVDPMDVGGGTQIALFIDPQGLTFGLFNNTAS
ncbi:MAG TPA: VOC family protein [Actinomycetota bacterium]|nr:VOC family protein [Actinomycetota bacterium]